MNITLRPVDDTNRDAILALSVREDQKGFLAPASGILARESVYRDCGGRVFVIEGRVVNEFPQPKELIAVEAAIYDKDKKALAVKKQLAGTQLSLFQLQVLSEKEMESFLNNKVEILTNNTNVRHGGEVPFMVLFYTPPDGVAEFGVKIVDVKDIPATGQ